MAERSFRLEGPGGQRVLARDLHQVREVLAAVEPEAATLARSALLKEDPEGLVGQLFHDDRRWDVFAVPTPAT